MKRLPAWVWIAVLATVALLMAIPEAIGLATPARGDTLSERGRYWMGIDPPKPRRFWLVPIFVIVMFGFPTWFVPHELWGWWTP